MGTAGLWKMLMLTWSYENDLAIPINDEKRDFVGGLSRLFKVGFSKKLRKMDYSSLYPSIQLAHEVFPSCDITHVMKSLLKYFHSERFKAKNLAKKYGKAGDKQMKSFYDRKQLPLKIFINSMFGALGAPTAFNWAEMDVAEGITARARQYLRIMVKFFMAKGLGFNSKDFAGIDNEWLKSIGGIRQNFKPVMTFAASKIEENKNILKESAPDQQFNPGAFLDDSIAVTTDKTTRMKKMLQTNAQLETQQQAQEQLDGNSEEQ